MKKFLAVLIALASAWVLFLPFDLPPFPFFMIDEALALVLLTKSLHYLGFDIRPWLPFFSKKNCPSPPRGPTGRASHTSPQEPVIDI